MQAIETEHKKLELVVLRHDVYEDIVLDATHEKIFGYVSYGFTAVWVWIV